MPKLTGTCLALALGASVLGFFPAAQAAPLIGAEQLKFTPAAELVQPAAYTTKKVVTGPSGKKVVTVKKKGSGTVRTVRTTRTRWAYSPKYGPRYKYRHGKYVYYYGGYYYPRPWWTLGPGISISF